MNASPCPAWMAADWADRMLAIMNLARDDGPVAGEMWVGIAHRRVVKVTCVTPEYVIGDFVDADMYAEWPRESFMAAYRRR